MRGRVGYVDRVAADDTGNLAEIGPHAEARHGRRVQPARAEHGLVLFDQAELILRRHVPEFDLIAASSDHGLTRCSVFVST